jgi:hypothetical protein
MQIIRFQIQVPAQSSVELKGKTFEIGQKLLIFNFYFPMKINIIIRQLGKTYINRSHTLHNVGQCSFNIYRLSCIGCRRRNCRCRAGMVDLLMPIIYDS